MKSGWVYLMANHRRGQTYLGVTSNLVQRAYQHRNRLIDGHSKVKNCVLLVWFEISTICRTRAQANIA